MGRLKYGFNVFVYANVIIALAAVAQCALTYLILDIPPQPFILLIDGCSTLLLYNFSLFLSRPRFPQQSPYERIRWFFRHRTAMYSVTTFAGGLLYYALFHIHYYTLFYLVFIGVLSLSYHVPMWPTSKIKGGFRQIPGLKLFYIAAIWSLSTVGLPVVEAWANDLPIHWYQVTYLGGIKVLFIAICTLPFDIRDQKQDAYYKLRTIPTMIGEDRSIRLNYVMLVIHSILVVFAPYLLSIKLGLLLANLFIAILLYTVIFNKKHHYYNNVYLLDLSLTLQYILVFGFYQLTNPQLTFPL